MYVINPTPEQKAEWYKCNLKTARYFVMTCPIIHENFKTGEVYFVKTNDWKRAYKAMPLWVRFLEKFGKN